MGNSVVIGRLCTVRYSSSTRHREQDSGRPREGHPLYDHGHVDLPVVDAVPQPVCDGSFGEQ
jgi:hypothetical protein